MPGIFQPCEAEKVIGRRNPYFLNKSLCLHLALKTF